MLLHESSQRGVLRLHTEVPAINSEASRQEAAQQASGLNTGPSLREKFFTLNHPRLIHLQDLESGGKVAVVVPTGPYSDEAVMVIAAGPDSLNTADEIDTEVVYDYPDDIQRAYWQAIVKSLEAFCAQPGGSCHVLAAENCIAVRTNEQVRTSRTVALPHTHVLRIEEAAILAEDWQLPDLHIEFEQRALRLAQPLLEELQSQLSEATEENFQLMMREHAPYGYSFELDHMRNIDAIAQKLRVHHQIYSQVANQVLAGLNSKNNSKIIPQPSYRLFLVPNDSMLTAIISPEILSHAGVMEAAGIKLDRQITHPQRRSEEQKRALRNIVYSILMGQIT